VVRLWGGCGGRRAGGLLAAGLLAAGIGGCGGGRAATTSRTAAAGGSGELASSTSCMEGSSVASSPSGRHARTVVSGSCVFVLRDGQRFRCPLRFQRGPTSVSLIEHAKACVRLSTLVVPVALRAVAARIGRVRACLTVHGLSVIGGLVFPPAPLSPESPSSPAGELDIADSLIAFYSDPGQAQRAEPAIVKNVRRFGGQVQRAGAENVAWIASPPNRLRDIVQTCTAG